MIMLIVVADTRTQSRNGVGVVIRAHLGSICLPGGNILVCCTFSIFIILGNSVAQFLDMIMHIH